KHRTKKRVPARSVVRAREPSLPRPLDRWCAPFLAAVRTERGDRRLGATLAPTPESSRRSASPGRQLRQTVVVTQALAFPTASTARSYQYETSTNERRQLLVGADDGLVPAPPESVEPMGWRVVDQRRQHTVVHVNALGRADERRLHARGLTSAQ